MKTERKLKLLSVISAACYLAAAIVILIDIVLLKKLGDEWDDEED